MYLNQKRSNAQRVDQGRRSETAATVQGIHMPRLTEQEQQEIIRYIEADKPLPDK